MIQRAIILAAFFGLTACNDETISGFVLPDAPYYLVSINGTPFPARATIRFPRKGIVEGTAPCNQWSALQVVPYPWFEIGEISKTRRACVELEAENTFFQALGSMTLSEAAGNTLLLTSDDGNEMHFRLGQQP